MESRFLQQPPRRGLPGKARRIDSPRVPGSGPRSVASAPSAGRIFRRRSSLTELAWQWDEFERSEFERARVGLLSPDASMAFRKALLTLISNQPVIIAGASGTSVQEGDHQLLR